MDRVVRAWEGKRERWGKREDVRLFKVLREACEYYCIPFESFLEFDYTTMADQELIFGRVMGSFPGMWKAENFKLVRRVYRLCQKQSFSLRDRAQFNRIMRKQVGLDHTVYQQLQ